MEASVSRNARAVVQHNWVWDDDDRTHAAIQTASVVHGAREVEKIASALSRIALAIDSLGVDGLHALVRLALKRTRRLERVRRKKKR